MNRLEEASQRKTINVSFTAHQQLKLAAVRASIPLAMMADVILRTVFSNPELERQLMNIATGKRPAETKTDPS
jgi:hypothetical protein